MRHSDRWSLPELVLGSVPGRNTYILNELGVGYRMIDEDTDARPES